MASELQTSSVDLNGFASRIWKKGEGPTLGFLAGFGGLPRWIPFLDALARERTVIVPSLPGFPGGERVASKAPDNHCRQDGKQDAHAPHDCLPTLAPQKAMIARQCWPRNVVPPDIQPLFARSDARLRHAVRM